MVSMGPTLNRGEVRIDNITVEPIPGTSTKNYLGDHCEARILFGDVPAGE